MKKRMKMGVKRTFRRKDLHIDVLVQKRVIDSLDLGHQILTNLG